MEYDILIEDLVAGGNRSYSNAAGAFGSFGDIEALPSSAAAPLVFDRHSSGSEARQVDNAPSNPSGSCAASSTTVCLLDGRFAVEGSWLDFDGNSGTAFAESLTPDTGYLWFFDEDVVEIVAKVVDGRGFNDHYWVYYGSLSNVEFTLYVTDTATGEVRPYFNPLGSFGSFGDIEAFPAN